MESLKRSNGQLGTTNLGAEAQFDPWRIVASLRKYKWVVIGVALMFSLAVVFWTLRQPKIFRATAVLEYNPNPPRPLGSEVEELIDPVINFWQSREWYETQNKIIESRAISERVVRDLGLDRDADFHNVPNTERKKWKGVSIEETAEKLQQRISVEQIKDTRLVKVHVEDRSPERAMTLVNTLTAAYIEKILQDRLRSTVSALEWLSTQLDSKKRELEASEQRLHEFKKDNNVLSLALEDRQNMIATDLEHYSKGLAQAKTKRIEVAARLRQLRAAYDENPLNVNATLVAQHPAISKLRNQYREKFTEQKSMAVNYGAEHPQMKAIAEELEGISQQMRDEIRGLIESTEAELREVEDIERGLENVADNTHRAGLELNRQEIKYNVLQRERENSKRLYNILLERTTQTDLTKMLQTSHVQILDRALRPKTPVRPNLKLNIVLGLFAGLVLGIAIVLIIVRMDRTIRSVEDAEVLGFTVLGVLPSIPADGQKIGRIRYGKRKRKELATAPQDSRNRDLVVHTHPMSSVAECVRIIRTNITFMAADQAIQTAVVTSAGPLEGKTTVAISIALSIAQSGKSVLLVDTDLRRPRIHKAFGMNSNVGITSALVGEKSLDESVQIPEGIEGLHVLPCGPIPPNPSELLHGAAFRQLMEEAKSKYDRVIFDSPPLGAVTDAAVIAPQVDGAVMVLKAQKTRRDAARSAQRRLLDVSSRILGAVLNDVDLSEGRYGHGGYYYYGGGYRYISNTEQNEEKKDRDAA